MNKIIHSLEKLSAHVACPVITVRWTPFTADLPFPRIRIFIARLFQAGIGIILQALYKDTIFDRSEDLVQKAITYSEADFCIKLWTQPKNVERMAVGSIFEYTLSFCVRQGK